MSSSVKFVEYLGWLLNIWVDSFNLMGPLALHPSPPPPKEIRNTFPSYSLIYMYINQPVTKHNIVIRQEAIQIPLVGM